MQKSSRNSGKASRHRIRGKQKSQRKGYSQPAEMDVEFSSARNKYWPFWIIIGLLGGIIAIFEYEYLEVIVIFTLLLACLLPIADWRYRLKYDVERGFYLELFLFGLAMTFVVIAITLGVGALVLFSAGGAI